MTIYESLGIEKDLLDIEIPKDTILDNLQRVTLPNSAEYYFSVIDRVVLRASINRSGYDLQIIEVKLNDAKYISEISFIIQTAIKYQIIFIFSFDNRYLFARRSFKLTEMTEHVYSEHLSASSDWIYEESLIDDILMFNTIEEIQEDNEENLLWQEDSEYPIYKLFSDITNNIVKLNSCVLDSNVVCLRQFCDWYSGHSVQSHFGIREIINKIIKRDGVELLNDTIFFEKNILSHEICSLEDAKFLRDVDHLGRYPYKYFDNIQLLFYEEIEEYVLDNIYKIDSYQAYNSKQFIEETLDAYYKLVGHYPLLDEKEEKSLLKKMKDGDTEAYNRLVCSNLRLVVHVAKKYINRGLDVDDLIQEGTLGLITALKRYDAKFHSRISTYAMYWIKQSIQRAIYDTGNLIRFPVHMHETINTFKSAYKKIEKEQGNIPTVKMMADTLGCSEERIVEISKFVENNVIYDDTINDDGDTVFDLINDDQNDSAERFVYNKKLKEQVLAVLDTLTPREEKVLRLRYGIDDGKPKTLEEVGQHFNNTRERIRQIEAKALRKLRHPSRSKRLKDYLYESYDDAQIDLTAVSELNLWINEHYERRYPLRLKEEKEYKNTSIIVEKIDKCKERRSSESHESIVLDELYRPKAQYVYVEPEYTIEECKNKAAEYGAKNDLYNKFKWLLKAAEKGDSDAQNDVGVAYAKGEGVSASAIKAVEWYEKSAKQGNAYALSNLAYRYYSGTSPCQKNLFKAKDYWICAVVALHREDDIKQLNEKFPGWQVSGHPRLMFNDSHWRYQLEPMAKLGVPSAEYWYGKHLLTGRNGCKKDSCEARRWLLLSSAHSYSLAKTTLEVWFDIDTEEAKTSVEMFNCGAKYSKQTGQQAEDLTFYWYYRAYHSGYNNAANNLGVCYDDGKGVSKNVEEANKLYLVGISQSNSGSYYNYAYNLYFGIGVAKDIIKAKDYMIKAADLDSAVAKEFLQKHFGLNRVNYKSFDQLWFKHQENVGMSFYKIEVLPEGLKLTFWCSNCNSTNRTFWIESCVVDGEKQTGWKKLVELDGQKKGFVSYLIENKQKADRIEIKIEVDKDSTTKLFSYPLLVISLNNVTGEVKPFFSSYPAEDLSEDDEDEYVTDFDDIEFVAYDDEDVNVEFCNFEVENGEVYAKFWITNNRDEIINVYAQDIYIDGEKVSDYELIAEVEANESDFGRIKLSSIRPNTYYNVKAYIEIDDEDTDFIDRGDVFSIDVDFEDGTLTAEFDE